MRDERAATTDNPLIPGVTDMPEDDIHIIAEFMGVPADKVQGIVYLAEKFQREKNGRLET